MNLLKMLLNILRAAPQTGKPSLLALHLRWFNEPPKNIKRGIVRRIEQDDKVTTR